MQGKEKCDANFLNFNPVLMAEIILEHSFLCHLLCFGFFGFFRGFFNGSNFTKKVF